MEVLILRPGDAGQASQLRALQDNNGLITAWNTWRCPGLGGSNPLGAGGGGWDDVRDNDQTIPEHARGYGSGGGGTKANPEAASDSQFAGRGNTGLLSLEFYSA